MNTTIWEECFTEFYSMSEMARMVLRQCASDRLSCKGFEEIGSSDINHELYHMWSTNDYDWHNVLINEAQTISDL